MRQWWRSRRAAKARFLTKEAWLKERGLTKVGTGRLTWGHIATWEQIHNRLSAVLASVDKPITESPTPKTDEFSPMVEAIRKYVETELDQHDHFVLQSNYGPVYVVISREPLPLTTAEQYPRVGDA